MNQHRFTVILIIALLLLSFRVVAQPPIPNSIYSSPLYRYGQYLGVDSGLLMRFRRDTGFKPNTIMAMPGLDGLPYWWDGSKWWGMTYNPASNPIPPSTNKPMFATVQQMMAYNGSAVECTVTDSLRGGYFLLKTTTGIIDSGMTFPSGVAGKMWSRDITQTHALYLSWYGAKGDGVTNDYYRVKAFSNYITGDSITRTISSIYFGQSRTYFCSFHGAGAIGTNVSFRHLSGVTIYGGNSTIIEDGNYIQASDVDYMFRVSFDSCKNTTINDLIIDGQNQLTNANGHNENVQHAFALNACEGIVLNNCVALNAGCDGFNINEGSNKLGTKRLECRNITMVNCRSFFAARQGISIIQCVGFIAINCVFKYTGQNPLSSHAPASGCDIEPNRTINTPITATNENTSNILFENCIFAGNNGSQFVCGGTPGTYRNVTLENSILNDVDSLGGTVYRATSGGYSVSLQGEGIRVMNNRMTFSGGFLGLAYGINDPTPLATSDVLLEGNTFKFEYSSYQWIRGATSSFRQVKFVNNIFIGDSTCKPFGSSIPLMELTNVIWESNYLFMPKEKFRVGDAGDGINIAKLDGKAVVRNSVFVTDLTTTYAGATSAHFTVNMQGAIIENVAFIGTNPGTKETIRPINGTNNYGNLGYNSTQPLTANRTLMTDSLLIDGGISTIPNKIMYKAAVPTSGDYIKGDIIFNNAAAAGSNAGWVCITASVNSNGGTWQTFGSSAAALVRLSSIDRGKLRPQEGDEVYDTDYHAKMVYDGRKWTGFRYKGLKFQGYNGIKWINLEMYK